MLAFSSNECIAWLAVFMAEGVAIVALNIVTVIVFMKNRNLRTRSMNLVISLAVADMFVGGISEVLTFYKIGTQCRFWRDYFQHFGIWIHFVAGIEMLFPVTSITNLAAISLERVHAVFLPFRHRLLKRRAYVVLTTVIWVTAFLFSAGSVIVRNLEGQSSNYFYVWCSFNLVCLFVICVSYASICLKIYFGVPLQHHGAAASRERKLTKTLFIVTLVSLTMWLPYFVCTFLYFTTDILSPLSILRDRLTTSLTVLWLSNSFLNPILYALKMSEFKRTLISLFRCKSQKGQYSFRLRTM